MTWDRITSIFRGSFVGCCLAACLAPLGAQQPDTARGPLAQTHVLRTRDGSVFVGQLIGDAADSIRFLTIGGAIVVARANVTGLRALPPRAVRHGEYWVADPNDTRLFFAPTGRMLAKGDGYFSDTYLLLLNFVGGVTPRFTMGGGFSIIPSNNPQNNIVYITPKVGLVQGDYFNLAIGGVAAFAGFEGADDWARSFGIVYGVGTIGSPDASLTFGTGVAYTGNGIVDQPVAMLGGSVRAGRRASLVTENYIFPSEGEHGIVSYGVRFFGDKLSVDLAFWNIIGTTLLIPGIPYVAVAVKF